jgi:hypothetical protein
LLPLLLKNVIKLFWVRLLEILEILGSIFIPIVNEGDKLLKNSALYRPKEHHLGTCDLIVDANFEYICKTV